MKISENKLRDIIKESILSEISWQTAMDASNTSDNLEDLSDNFDTDEILEKIAPLYKYLNELAQHGNKQALEYMNEVESFQNTLYGIDNLLSIKGMQNMSLKKMSRQKFADTHNGENYATHYLKLANKYPDWDMSDNIEPQDKEFMDYDNKY